MEVFKRIAVMLMCASMLFVSVVPSYSDVPPTTKQQGDYNVDDSGLNGGSGLSGVENAVVGALEQGESTLYNVCKALFPISIAILILAIFLTRNDKKISIYVGLAGGACLALLGIMLVENGTAVNFLQSIADMLAF